MKYTDGVQVNVRTGIIDSILFCMFCQIELKGERLSSKRYMVYKGVYSMSLSRDLKNLFWKIPIPPALKEKMHSKYVQRKFALEGKKDGEIHCVEDADLRGRYCDYILNQPTRKNPMYREYEVHDSCKNSATLIAYYLTQYSPDDHNDIWWGKGTTEWNNVAKAVPQFEGHRQPRLPGELGFYDLRIRDVMARQIEMAKNYGVNVFSFYYYWFAGERILEKPLNMFLNDKTLDMPFMFCWANENWTKRFSGTNDEILIGMENTKENYKAFIHEVIPFFSDPRYFRVNGRIVLQIYRPELIPNVENVLQYWREETRKALGADLYLIACQSASMIDFCSIGFDAENEWMQGTVKKVSKEITDQIHSISKNFGGQVFDYEEMVLNKRYLIKTNRSKKVYPAVMPTWDNSARRNNKGTIWQNSSPDLYKRWLTDIICEVNGRKELDAPIVFINAWNEWGEGAYLEPDRDLGFAYLQATWEAKNELKWGYEE